MKLMQVFGDLDALKTDKTIADVLQTRDNNLINLFKNTFANSLLKNLSVQKFERKNTNFNYNKNNWTKFIWQTAAADLKSRHFKWDPQGKEIDSQTGRINKIVFKEI